MPHLEFSGIWVWEGHDLVFSEVCYVYIISSVNQVWMSETLQNLGFEHEDEKHNWKFFGDKWELSEKNTSLNTTNVKQDCDG